MKLPFETSGRFGLRIRPFPSIVCIRWGGDADSLLLLLLRGTEGNFHEDVLVRYIMSLQYQTIFLGEASLLARLRADFPVCL